MDRRETVQRSIILEAIRSIFHPTVNEIYEQVREKYPQIGKATVYRTVNLLCEEGTLKRIGNHDGETIYDWKVTNHYHLKCSSCNKIYDLDLEYLDHLDERLNQAGIQVLDHELLFNGICPKCQQKENNNMEE